MSSRDQNHADRMRRKKAAIDARIAAARTRRGVFLLSTGTGKGKSTAAFGLLARALGHGMRAVVVQFVKSRCDTGEEVFFRGAPGVEWHTLGAGFTWETQDAEQDADAAAAAWAVARRALADPGVGLVILDEFTYALKYGWIAVDEALAVFHGRPAMQHLVVTGRAAPPALIEAADTVTEMRLVKHAFQAGVMAMPGVEF
ncbi:MAG: cob(I)yrinic acid a,c-diamide adenosyltransferase [Casimicrobiaceae bacterium]|nr:cob(I)yrinic acid a,c-diamide adenosyltransferase [Casimicrobiaceae bacterium]